MVEKIVQRVEFQATSREDDGQAFFDCLTFELGFGSDDRSLSGRLAQLVEAGRLGVKSAEVVVDAVKRLRAVDVLLKAHGL